MFGCVSDIVGYVTVMMIVTIVTMMKMRISVVGLADSFTLSAQSSYVLPFCFIHFTFLTYTMLNSF